MDIAFNTAQISGVLALFTAVAGLIAALARFLLRQQKESTELKELEKMSRLHTRALFAVLAGLLQQGCGGEVREMYDRLRDSVLGK